MIGTLNAGIDFLEFKASEIAAATALYVSGEIRAMDVDKELSGFIIEKVVFPTNEKSWEDVLYNLMHETGSL